jgi:hypothetical protein
LRYAIGCKLDRLIYIAIGFWSAHERPTLGLPDQSDSRGASASGMTCGTPSFPVVSSAAVDAGRHDPSRENRNSKFDKLKLGMLRAFRLMRWHTATAHKRKSAGLLTSISAPADLSCPSWARTRTLLIQSRCRWGSGSGQVARKRSLTEHRCPLPALKMLGSARRNCSRNGSSPAGRPGSAARESAWMDR